MSRSTFRAKRNSISRARLERSVPAVFPRPVLVHALSRPLIPALPRLAVESYWRAHPVRADRLCRALASRTGPPEGWVWSRNVRSPPAPFREAAFRRGPGSCCICGQPVYRFGWHRDLWGEGTPNRRAAWHACCVAAWKLWNAPTGQARLLRRLQRRRCGVTGQRLLRTAEIDHRTPLSTVWRDHRQMPWPQLLEFWGIPNLQAVNKVAHAAKSAREAADRAQAGSRRGSNAPATG